MKHFLYLCILIPGILLSCKHPQINLQAIEGQQMNINDSIPGNDSLEAFIAPYRERISAEMDRVLSYAPFNMNKQDGDLNTALGNMMADAVMEMAGPVFEARTGEQLDMVLLNHGGIRSGISQGKITVGTAYQLMPFENEVVVANLDAQTVRAMVDYLVKEQVAHPIAGIQIAIDEDTQTTEVLIGGQPIVPGETYYVATNDYLFEGGDRMDFFSASKEKTVLDYKIRNLLIDYFQQEDSISPKIDNRFTRKK